MVRNRALQGFPNQYRNFIYCVCVCVYYERDAIFLFRNVEKTLHPEQIASSLFLIIKL